METPIIVKFKNGKFAVRRKGVTCSFIFLDLLDAKEFLPRELFSYDYHYQSETIERCQYALEKFNEWEERVNDFGEPV